MFYESAVDIIRTFHLVFFAAGMGTGLFFDFRSLRSMSCPITHYEVKTLREIHSWIMLAFGGLWLTGVVMIYIRTGFDLAAFSPKLFAKIGLMLLMAANAILIVTYVMPIMSHHIGQSLFSLPLRKFILILQIGINSIFAWSAGLVLGSSVTLITAEWSSLLMLLIGGFLVMTMSGHFVVFMLRLASVESGLARGRA